MRLCPSDRPAQRHRHPAHRAMRAAMAAARWATTCTARTPPSTRSGAGGGDVRARGGALHPTGSLANLLAVRSLVAPGQEVLCESSAHIARAELGAHGARRRRHHAHLDLAARPGRPGRDLGDVRSRHGAVLRPHPAVRSRTPTTSPAARCVPLADLEALRSWSGPVGVARAPGRRADLERARRHGHAAGGVRRAGRRAGRLLLQGARRPVGSMLVGSEAAVTEARVWRKRLGGGMRQVGVLAAAASSRSTTTRAAGRGPRPRAAAGGGLRRRPRRRGDQHRGARPAGRARSTSGPRASRGC